MRSGMVYAAGIGLAAVFWAVAAGQGASKEISAQPAFVFGPTFGKAFPQVSVPVRSLPHNINRPEPPAVAPRRVNPLQDEPDHGRRGTWTRGEPPRDPLIERSQNRSGHTPPPDIVFGGLGNPFACGGCAPGDPNGDTDQQYFVQMVNATKVGIFDRQGNLAIPAFDLASLWTSGPCTNNLGDPQARYDRDAHRWILAQLQKKDLCFAVSQTSDPVGVYYLYDFNIGDLADYYKIGMWQNAYYVGANEKTYTAYAFDRAKMLAGAGATFIKFSGETNFLMPADADGTDWASDAGYFYTFKDNAFHGGKDRIELFRLTPNFDKPQKSTFKLASTFNIAPFTYTVCGFFKEDCIPQKGTKQKIDALSEWPMQRFEYRKLGKTWQELVGNFTVGGGKGSAGAAIRWFELRNTGKGWKLWQEGTQDLGDGLDRFMGSISMDKDGNIALGYSASGKNDYPSIRYATRLFSDASGKLGPETVLKAGGGAQTGSNRWGDYSAMSVDPGSGCQFWYTNQYYPIDSAKNWATAVGAFTIPQCGGGATALIPIDFHKCMNTVASYGQPIGTSTGNAGTDFSKLSFTLTDPSAGNNSWLGQAENDALVIKLSVNSPAAVYTMMNTWWGDAGIPNALVTLHFADGRHKTFALMGNDDIRDYNNSEWTNEINGKTTQEWWTTADQSTRLDVQELKLGSDFAGATLDKIVVTAPFGTAAGSMEPILFALGISAAVTSIHATCSTSG